MDRIFGFLNNFHFEKDEGDATAKDFHGNVIIADEEATNIKISKTWDWEGVQMKLCQKVIDP